MFNHANIESDASFIKNHVAMPKRPVTDQSDSESDGAQVSAKRTRTRRADESDDDQAGPSRSRHQPAQGGSDGESDVDEEMVLPVPEAVDEEEFERLNTDQIRKMLMEKKETVKVISDFDHFFVYSYAYMRRVSPNTASFRR